MAHHGSYPRDSGGSIQPCYHLRVTPSLVTERACKTCAFGHAVFNSRVTHHADKGLRKSPSLPTRWPGFDSPCPRQIRLGSSVVERWFEKPCVGSSILPLGTNTGR